MADYIVTVGLRSKFIAQMAERRRFNRDRLHHFDNARAAGIFLQTEIKKGDVILVKGSQSMRMERVVEEIMAQPALKASLLVRQDADWQKRV